MRLGKAKPPEEQGRVGRQVQRVDTPGAFSYYTSRPTGPTTERPAMRQDPAGGQGKAGYLPRFSTQLPLWLLIAVAMICLGKVMLLGTNPKIVIVGQNGVSTSYAQPTDVYAKAARNVLAASITNRTKLTVNTAAARTAMEKEFPEMQAVSMALPLVGNRPIMYLDLAQPTLILQTGHGSYALNATGVVLARVSRLPSGVPLVVDQSATKPTPGKQYLPSSTVDFIKTIGYQTNVAKLSINTFVLPPDKPYELDMRVAEKPYVVRFNLQADARQQSGAAIAAIAQLGSDPTEYLDIRVPGRVYYK